MGTENASSSCFPSSSTSASRWTYEYDVFLSFRGSDTRKKFTSHLYEALKRNGITTFRDDESLDRGAFIKPELLKAIEESKIAVVIFSRDYASSSWCLTELAKVYECMAKKKLIVLPVFHDVDPSDVRKLRGTFEDAFTKHLIDNTENVQTWKDAVTKVAGISGWDLRNEPESTVIEEIIQSINKLDCEVPSVSEHLVGMESRVQEMLDLCLGERLDCVRFVGICGIGGIGKTTLAREIYNKIFRDFEASCFIDNIREASKNQRLVSLQEQLLSKILMSTQKNISHVNEGINVLRKRLCNKKVLIVLDDVNEEEQLKALAGEDEWFGVGSVIIVTSRDRHLLSRHGVKHTYEVKELNGNEAWKLFSWKTFKKPHPEENYVDLSKHFVNYADGLPLALEVLGSLLFGKRIDEWKSALEKLEKEPDNKIFSILKISFDGLTKMQQELFLDIACFFKGKHKDGIIDILQSFDFCPAYNIGVLVDRSLITIEYGILCMHDLLQEMGRDIVRRESLKELGRRSRLWRYEDVLHVLKNNIGTKFVEGIVLKTPAIKKEDLSVEAFSKMTNLRFLKIGYVQPPQDLISGPIQLPQGLNYLSNELRVIDWHGYPLKSLPTSFQPNKLVELRMQCSDIKQLWKGIMFLNELKLIDLSDSQNLIEIPDLSGAPNLKQLILQRCTRLYKIHASLGDLKKLIRLDLNDCKRLESLPHKINLESLKTFIISGCSRLKKFPEVVGNMLCLLELSLNETAIRGLPLSIEHLIGLIKLDLRDCKNLSSLPNGCYSSMSLKSLNLSGCSKLVKLPENLGNIETLEELDVSGTAIRGLPLSIEHLISLIKLDLRDCKNLSSLPNGCYSSMSLKILNLSGCSKLDELPKNLGKIEGLKELDLSGTAITGLPSSVIHLKNLKVLSLSSCMGLSSNKPTRFHLMQPRRSPDPMGMLERSLIGLCSLTKLDLSYCHVRTIPNVLGCLSSLEILNLRGNNFVSLPESIIQLSKLRYLYMGGCTHLRMLPELPLNINIIDATECTSLETLSLRPESNFRPKICLINCDKLIKNQGYGDLLPTMLRHYIINQGLQKKTYSFHVEIPGSEIPKWFSHQNVGGSVNLQVPSDLSGNKSMGIAVCAVFVFCQHHPLHQLDIIDYEDVVVTHEIRCSVESNIQAEIILSEEFGKIESYQLWVEYFPPKHFEEDWVWEEILNQVDANGLSQIEVKFEPFGPGLEVTKCGAHLVFERDIEDLINQTKAGPSNCIITPYDEDGFEDSEKDTKIKRSSDHSDGEGAGPSAEATSNDEPPHLKWIRHPDLIENWFGNSHT